MNISVVIPTYNRCDFLRRALLSVVAQTLQPTEIIVVDDGSSDSTAVMIRDEFPEIKYYRQENYGVSSARNLGIQHAIGDWIALLDSDDEWLPEKLAMQTAALFAAPESKICHTEEQWIRNGVRVNPAKQYIKPGGWIFKECLPLCAISPSTVMIHRSVFDDVGLFDTDLPACEDYDLWLRITTKYPVLLVAEPQIKKHGGHQDQLTQLHWGMDRFRIASLQKIIDAGQLSTENQQAAVGMLLKKAEIYLNGVIKRGKEQEINYYRKLIKRHVD
ncbi:MAG: glycosyltransferase family A protein [Methylococcaceae bacterium]|nr:glycosyltransferase family A protein [Methylococcaceae bacterium]MDZ4155406.1 glycosyltransferase family A protein [Methylococcales bacterium]MDP2392958.1 glycosyltransferase family A protein [Methylococcaceae bacterium]MDP3018292.1 glycosyltransferase family A protein [Methylococcaceae bacterium]MDP3391606.1 glycosyltransferase family A protein [Methylococcaceae bacterium]